MNGIDTSNLSQTAMQLFAVSKGIFWTALPPALILALLMMYLSGQISSAKVESILRRLLVAIALLVAFPEISALLTNLDHSLVDAFGGDQSIATLFSKIADQVKDIKDTGVFSWIKVGQMGLSLITTISYIVLAFVQKFLFLLRLLLWNLLHVLGPIALLGCLFPSFEMIPRGIFVGLLEISLWRPVWVILGQLLLSLGFGSPPTGISDWLDLAIMNFAVAALMVSTPSLVHGFLSGTLASVGGSSIQSMIGGAGAFLAGAPAVAAKKGLSMAKNRILKPAASFAFKKPAGRIMDRIKGNPETKSGSPKSNLKKSTQTKGKNAIPHAPRKS
jgi:hypothetical protein